jgi:hypothetical protein
MEPITKVRFKERISFLCLLIVFHGAFASMPRCEKSPLDQAAGKIGGDNGFSISVSGSPRKYRPNQVYTLNLSVSSTLSLLYLNKGVIHSSTSNYACALN